MPNKKDFEFKPFEENKQSTEKMDRTLFDVSPIDPQSNTENLEENDDNKLNEKEELKRRSIKKGGKKKKIIKRTIITLLLLMLIGTGIIAWQIQSIKNAINKSNVELTSTTKTNFTKEPTNILIAGVDEAFDERTSWRDSQNTDTILMVRFDPINKKITTATIPRDVLAKSTCAQSTVPNQYVKINSIAAQIKQLPDKKATINSGLNCLVDSLDSNYKIKINEVVRVNFKAVIDLVDQIGGLEFAPDPANFGPGAEAGFCAQDEYGLEDVYCFKPGVSQKFTGAQALAYARERKIDSDFYRGLRQQEIVFQISQKMKKDLTVFTKIPTIIESVGNNMITTFTGDIVNDITTLATSASGYQTKSLGKLETVKIGFSEDYEITDADLLKLEKAFNGSEDVTKTAPETTEKKGN